ncbi:ATP-binding cassette domain-containing protein [Egibacter rhizosphaerae]|uniref:ABC-type quaternary amine transporter n=1 Tax=Egibacter rhizosphaerae TaxID=1670831 RepID=A0A411YAW4_9ACTN|nr:ABC transporter ATP-binding protein [Egibacter rhizosphaerae]QBI18319.1 ATP-binding cassette domain-containing protein [Egibacter rhizosphaerae]
MITFDSVSKQYGSTVAVRDLSMDVAEGEVAVLVGPSGCGKTTTLRLVNRMVEPTAGRILIDGSDAMSQPTHELRRGIGYVIQQTGLFQHRTVAGNIATVPQLLGWDKDRIAARVDELMDLVGLEREMAQRYPHQLSGGQRQRVGVARALAADPAIMLMDEPFGAVDPIVRERLQDEFRRLQAEVRKTIVFVTHDIDEAIKMGDRIAIFNVGGVLEQYDTPERLLAEPANSFVADFLGEERGLKRLALRTVGDLPPEPGATASPGTGVDEARHVAATAGTDWVVIVDDERPHGIVRLSELNGAGTLGAAPTGRAPTVSAADSLRRALETIMTNEAGLAVCTDGDGRYRGVLTAERLRRELR